MHDLKSAEGVTAYLEGTRFAASDVQLLSGGQSAFTYRIKLKAPLDTGEKTVVIKHFEGYFAAHEPMKCDVKRADHEYKALSAIASSGLFDSNSIVQLPRPIEYDQDTHTIFMSDLGSPMPATQVLEKGFPGSDTWSSEPGELVKQPNELASEIGHALGDFIGRFHSWSSLPEQSTLRAYFSLNPSVAHHFVYAHTFCLGLSADRFQMRETWIDEFIAKEQEEASADGGTLVMGDLSLHNILISPPSEHTRMRIYLTDLEAARSSYPELDIGELTASITSFARLHCPSVGQSLMTAFHKAYRYHCILDPKRIGTAAGIDLMGLGTVFPWARYQSEEKLREIGAGGLGLLRMSVQGDENSVKANPIVQHLFPSTSQQMI